MNEKTMNGKKLFKVALPVIIGLVLICLITVVISVVSRPDFNATISNANGIYVKLDGYGITNEKLYGKYASIGLQEYCRQIHLPHPEHYFNSGLILMDLKAIRSSGLELLKTACAHAGEDFLLPDQDLMNLYLLNLHLEHCHLLKYPNHLLQVIHILRCNHPNR